MTAAAQSLRMAQPALSRQIKLFEQDLGLTLFRPKGNRLVLTTAGERLVPMARRLMGEVDRFERGAATLSTGRASTLTVGTTEATLRNLLAPFIATVAKRHAPAFLGGIGLVSTFVALLVASLFSNLSIPGVSTWILGTVVVWLVTAVATLVLPLLFVRKKVQEKKAQ